MKKMKLKPGDVVQIEETAALFGGCFMTVLEADEWGAEGIIYVPRSRRSQPTGAHYRARWTQMEYVGHTDLVPA